MSIKLTEQEIKMATAKKDYLKYMDDLGRIVIPEEFRKYFSFSYDEPIKVCFTDEGILLKPFLSNKKRRDNWIAKMLAEMRTDKNSYTVSKFKNVTTLTSFPPKGKELKTSYAFCAKQDKYDRNVGTAVAYAKMKGYPIPKYI